MRCAPSFKTTFAILTFVGITLVPEMLPGLKDTKILDWRTVPAVLDFVPRKTSSAPIQQEQLRLRPDTDPSNYGVFRIIDPHNALDGFYASLQRTERREPGAVTRILHYGDSPTTADLITSDVRTLLQQRFGDAGHGFCLIAKPWAWYSHNSIDLSGSGWTNDPANLGGLKDGYYGLGAVSFRGEQGASAKIRTRGGGHVLLEASYLKQPGGGSFTIDAEGQVLGTVDTHSNIIEPGFTSFKIAPEAQRFEIRASSGQVRLFGVMFEKAANGIVYHSLGVNGAYVAVLAKIVNEKHWAEQLRHHRPDLVIINYGTNESVYPAYVDQAYEKEMKQLVHRVRTAVPNASILVMSPMDRGQREPGGEIGTVPVMTRLVALQQRVAADNGCAYFNTFQAMGGPGTMGRWFMAEPRLVSGDFIHPMPAGAKIVGNLLYRAVLDGYNRYKLTRMQQRFAKIKQ